MNELALIFRGFRIDTPEVLEAAGRLISAVHRLNSLPDPLPSCPPTKKPTFAFSRSTRGVSRLVEVRRDGRRLRNVRRRRARPRENVNDEAVPQRVEAADDMKIPE